jgi:hypothetical protein
MRTPGLVVYTSVNHRYAFINVRAPNYGDNKIHTGWLDTRIAMLVRSERPPGEISVVGGALYVSCTQYMYT